MHKRKYMCDQCTRKFRAQMKLREHVDAVHLKKKPFKCGVGDCDWITGKVDVLLNLSQIC